ncbi:MAG: ketopantoate reductase family protein [Christensenellales bacterium]|jgi:2-dehydropantoate 2-reductase
MEKIKNIAIVGMGALGVLYGEHFASKLGLKAVTFVADEERIAKYRTQGVYSNGKRWDFQLSSGGDGVGPADLLIFSVKGTALLDAIGEAAPWVGKDTIILSLLNGIVSEEIIGEALGNGHVLHCVAQGMDAVKLGNHLTYSHMGQLRIGVFPEERDKLPLLGRIEELFDRTGLPYMREENIKRRLWSKWMLNVGVNQVVMVERGNYGTVQQPGRPRELMRQAMGEVMILAEKEGVFLTEHDIDGYIELVDTLDPEGMPSMRQDGIERRPSEVELFSGTVLEKAKKHGLSLPVNEMLYAAIKEIEAGYGQE